MKIQKIWKRPVASFLLFMTLMFIWGVIFGHPAYASTSGNYTYTTNSNGTTVTITGYTGSGGAVAIPSTIGGKTVSAIGANSFSYKSITSVTIPSSVTSIGSSAFAGNGLTSVTFSSPSSVTSIGTSAFASNSLTSVTIPSSVTSIGTSAFASNSLTSVTIPSSVTSIRSQAFEYNKLTSVTFSSPSSVTSIGTSAFDHNSLTSVTVPSSVTSIGDGAFAHNSLAHAIIVNPSTTISPDPFSNNSTSVTLIGGVPSTTQTYANNYGYFFSSIINLNASQNSTVTNGSVSVSVTATVYGTSVGNTLSDLRWLSGSHTAADFGGGTAGTDIFSTKTFSVSANGTYTVYAKDAAGNEAVKEISVTNIAKLSGLSLNQGTVALTLTPTFSSNTTSGYTASVGNSVSAITVTPTVADTGDTVTVDGKSVTSGQPSGSIPLSVESNSITVVVTAQDGTTTQTYIIDVNRAASSDANLSGLTLSSGNLSPTFSSSTTNYTASVSNSVGSITVTPTVSDNTATVTVDGKSVASGKASGDIALHVGNNIIPIVVTAQSGATQTYTLTVDDAISAPTSLTHSQVTQTGWTEGWGPVLGATRYNIYLDTTKVKSTAASVYSYQFKSEKPGTTYSVQVSAVNGAGQESSLSTPDSVTTAVYGGGPVPPNIIQDSFTEPAQVGQKYTATVHEIGGTFPMNWSIASGALPPGLSLDNQGIISGTPTTTGKYTFTVKVTDAYNLSSTKQLTLTVNGLASTGSGASNGGTSTSTTPVTVTTGKEHSATINHFVSLQLQVNGGQAPYTWSVVGALPKGLSLNSTTGILSGTPDNAGVHQVTVKVTGAKGTTSEKTITLDVLHNYDREVLWNGTVKNVPVIVQKEGTTNTTYMPIWYVMQLLKPIGIQSTWDGKHWHMTTSTRPNLSNIQAGNGNTGIYLNGTLVQNVNTVAQNDPSTNRPTTYMPIWYVMQLLKRVGLQSTWNGTTWTVTK